MFKIMAFSSQATLLLFLLGLLVRLPLVNQPIKEGYRNAQTATLTAGMLENGKLRLDPIAPWRGDLNARLTLELPLYNLTVLAIMVVAPILSLDTAGHLASLLFWAASFWVVQGLWRRLLPASVSFWANLAFIISPIGFYLSTAFMPETLLLLLSVLFLRLSLAYAESPRLVTFAGLALVALLGLLIKFPAFAHLGLFLAAVLFDRQGWTWTKRPVVWAAGAGILGCLLLWSRYITEVNVGHFAAWTGVENLWGFIGPLSARFTATYYLTLVGYSFIYVVPMLCAPFVLWGLWRCLRDFRQALSARVWIYLAVSALVYCMVWQKAAPAQNYYNLPNLVLLCGLFALGLVESREWLQQRFPLSRFSRLCLALTFGLALISLACLGADLLYRPDRPTVAAAKWLKTHAARTDIVLFQPLHSPPVTGYPHQPLLSHLSGNRSFVWTTGTPEDEKQRAWETSRYLIITQLPNELDYFEKIRTVKGTPPPAPLPLDAGNPSYLKPLFQSPEFRCYAIENFPSPNR